MAVNETFPWPRLGRPDQAGMRVVVTSPPAVEPVTLDEAKAWANVQNPDDDPLVTDLIVACREQVEADLGQALITQTRTLFLGDFPASMGPIRLPYPPLQSVVSLRYTNVVGTLTTLDPSGYLYTANATPGNIRLPFGQFWPYTFGWEDAVQISYVCGYGDTAAAVPMRIRLALRALIAGNYSMRESHFFMQGGTVSSTPLYEDMLSTARGGEYR